MPTNALKPLVLALLSHLPEDPSSAVIAVKPEIPTVVPANGQNSNSPTYDPAAIYLLELCTTLALRDDETVKELGGDVVEALQNVVRDATGYHPIMISRSIFYLLNLLHASYVSFTCVIEFIELLTFVGSLFPPCASCTPYHIKLPKRCPREIFHTSLERYYEVHQRYRATEE